MTTNAAFVVTLYPSDYVPSDQAARVAWLERHGVPPREAQCSVTAPLADFLRVGVDIDVDGTVYVNGQSYGNAAARLYRACRAAAARLATEAGSVPGSLQSAVRAAAFGVAEAEHQEAARLEAERVREVEREAAARRLEEEQRDSERKREAAAFEARVASTTVEQLRAAMLSAGSLARTLPLTVTNAYRMHLGATIYANSLTANAREAAQHLIDVLHTEGDDAEATLLEVALSDEQRERLRAGVLPEAERDEALLVHLCGDDSALFPALTDCGLHAEHDANTCPYDPDEHGVEIDSHDLDSPDLTAAEFARRKAVETHVARRVRDLGEHNEAVRLGLRVAMTYQTERTCCGCKGVGHSRIVMNVLFGLADLVLSRGYVLTEGA